MSLYEKTKDTLKSTDNMESLAREVEDPGLRAAIGIQIGDLRGEVADLLSPPKRSSRIAPFQRTVSKDPVDRSSKSAGLTLPR